MLRRLALLVSALAAVAAALPAAGARAEGIGLLSALGRGSQAQAQSGVADAPRSRLALRSGWREADGRHVAGLDIRLAEGWKTYWRVPGDAGIPPYFDWSGSENLAAVEVRWPAPIAFDTYGMLTLGYEDAVTLPLIVQPEDPSRPVALRLTFAYGLCADICIPAEAELALDLPAGAPDAADASDAAASISAALSAQPEAMDAAGVEVRRCALAGKAGDRRLEAVFALPERPAEAPVAVVEGPESLWFHAAEVRMDGREVRVSAPLDPASPGAQGGWLARDALRVTLLSDGGAVETTACAR